MSRHRILARILTPLAFPAACGVFIRALFSFVLAEAGLSLAVGYLI
ncbi:MAG: hypothetical protein PHR63_10270 [Methanoregulaceae archaeon]|jgi:hypothetical protein|nr:hypothetical protein [Methanoregulaceae archaeon]MDD5686116.1 hypothetical protein [Methanoregulaceae archaeon]